MSLELIDYQISLHGQPLFAPLNLRVERAQVAALLGASGSGKSTVLADISGVLMPVFQSVGEIRLHGDDLRCKPIEQRRVGILFQDDLLFPHLNVYDNLKFALPAGLNAGQQQARIQAALAEAELVGYDRRDITTLSGGQRARISLLRTLLSEPELILLDEPFGKLDRTLRQQFRQWVFAHIRQLNIPTVLVTHDADDIPTGSTTLQLEPYNA